MIVALMLAAAAPASAAADAEPTRYNVLTVYGSDACPRSSDEEVVVCARLPESERYRIPKKLRQKKSAEGQASLAWSEKVQALEYVGKVGLPNSCSPVGSGGATGCFQQFMRQARAERAQDAAERAQEQP